MENDIEENLDSELLEIRHRKEKKELQAHIQGLKKVAKNDKTKKKELITEIARLEAELDNRHKMEIESITTKITSENNSEYNNESEHTKTKISKAQKRREKKEQQEREREQQIRLQEKENVNGPRNTENQAIYNRLKEKGLKVYPIPSDGDCLYKAVAHQLLIKKEKALSVDELRKCTAAYIREHKEDFIPFLTHPETCNILTDEEFDEYCLKIINSKIWGGQIEVRALSNYLKCPITIIQATGPVTIEQGQEFEGPSLTITYHRHMYRLGEHYNSTQNFQEEITETTKFPECI